jgi:mRNA-degrading endonuclease RelE of RelBE toxin-antitoxin system
MKYTEIVISYLTKIDSLKKDDYKIIKCFEAQLMNEPMPYDYEKLIEERKQIRLDIADLEARKLALEQSGKEEE